MQLNRCYQTERFAPLVFAKFCVWRKGSSRCLPYLCGRALSAFIPAFMKCRWLKEHRHGYQRVKSEASSPRDNAGRRISHRPSHPRLYSALAGDQRVFASAFRAVRKPSIVCLFGAGPPDFMSLIAPRRRRVLSFVFIRVPVGAASPCPVGVRCWEHEPSIHLLVGVWCVWANVNQCFFYLVFWHPRETNIKLFVGHSEFLFFLEFFEFFRDQPLQSLARAI